MQKFGNIPVSWNIDDFKNLTYKLDPDPIICQEYSSVGHSLEAMKFYNCFEPDINFSLDKILINFNFLSKIRIAVNLFTPGQYIPLHADKYEKFIKINQLPNSDSIVRIILMLEDNEPGQFLQIENNIVSSWKAGDCFSWKSSATHAFYNLSKKNRYSLQITGLSNDQYTQ
jgi:hypothetical protein